MKSKYKLSKVADRWGIYSVFLAIGELNGFKFGTIKEKFHFGINCWLNNTLHNLDLNLEEDRKEAYENIWLERLYLSLDKHFQVTKFMKAGALENRTTLVKLLFKHRQAAHEWDVPIELDATASMIQWEGVLLNDRRLLEKTNVLATKDGILQDIWTIQGLTRNMVKWAATPMLYGSSRACHELWKSKKCQFDLSHITIYSNEINQGALGLANALKDFIINECKPQEVMKVQIFNETIEIQCNRYRTIGDKTIVYELYDSVTKSVRKIVHTTTKQVADLEQFRRYFVTLLVHNIDSQAANHVSNHAMDKYGWLIDIYDAFIIHPNMARDVRKWYREFLILIHSNRTSILNNFFKSIGIGPESQSRWNAVAQMVQPIEGQFKPSMMALK